jgi:IclR family transcriptional regulator, acetate operon repressor
MGLEYYGSLDRTELLQPLLLDLAERFQETAHYAELDGGDVVYLSREMPPALRIQMSAAIGGRNPAYCTGLGKALLAELLTNEQAVADYVDKHGPLVRRTPNLITDTAELHRELELSRRRGYALDDQESDPPGSTASPSPSTSPPTRSHSAPSASRPCRTAPRCAS